jgi:hypothetical protein
MQGYLAPRLCPLTLPKIDPSRPQKQTVMVTVWLSSQVLVLFAEVVYVEFLHGVYMFPSVMDILQISRQWRPGPPIFRVSLCRQPVGLLAVVWRLHIQNNTKTKNRWTPYPRVVCEPMIQTFEQQKTKKAAVLVSNFLSTPHLRETLFWQTDEILQLKR